MALHSLPFVCCMILGRFMWPASLPFAVGPAVAGGSGWIFLSPPSPVPVIWGASAANGRSGPGLVSISEPLRSRPMVLGV